MQGVEGADDIGQHRLDDTAGLRTRAHEGQGDDTDGVHVAHGDAPRQRVAVVPVDDLFGQALHDSSIFAQRCARQRRDQTGELSADVSAARRSGR